MAFQGSGGFQKGAFQRFKAETADTTLTYDGQASVKLQFPQGSGLVEVFADARCYSPAIDANSNYFYQATICQNDFMQSPGSTISPYLQPINTNTGMSLGF